MSRSKIPPFLLVQQTERNKRERLLRIFEKNVDIEKIITEAMDCASVLGEISIQEENLGNRSFQSIRYPITKIVFQILKKYKKIWASAYWSGCLSGVCHQKYYTVVLSYLLNQKKYNPNRVFVSLDSPEKSNQYFLTVRILL